MLSLNKPLDAVQRLVKRPHPSRTVLIVAPQPQPAGRYIAEVEIGYGWADALNDLWSGTYEMPLKVLDLDVDAPRVVDLTENAARQLAQRTFAEERTPEHLTRLFDAYGLDRFSSSEGSSRRNPREDRRLGASQVGSGQ